MRVLGTTLLLIVAGSVGCTQAHSTEEGSNGETEVAEESLGTTATPGKAVFTMPFAKAAALATASDSVGNIVVGTFWGKTLDVGGVVLTGSADAGTSDDEPPGDGWVAKIDPYGKTLWAKVIGGLRTQEVDAVAVDADGNIAIGGAYMGSPTICGTTFTNGADNSAFIAKLGPDGSCRWALPNAAPGYTILQRVAFDPSGNVFAIGSYSADRVSFGGATAFNASAASYYPTQQFLFKISPSGAGIFGKSYGDPKTATNPFFGLNFADLAIDGAGNVVLAGSFNGTVSFGGPAMTAQGSDDVMPGRTTKSYVTFLAKLANDGSFRWAKQFGTKSDGTAVAASTDGHIALGGTFLETLDFGSAYTETSGKSRDGYVAKLDADGKAMWVKHLWGSPYNMRVAGVAFDSYAQVVAAGHFDTGTLHIGGSSFTAGTNTAKAFVTKLSKVYGSTLWAKAYGTTGSGVEPHHFSLSGGNRILLPGSLNGSVDFGSGTVSTVGGGFLTRLAP
jgi:hypothetical protein